ncbi:MAG: hypothetical protein N2422_09100 [Rhodobacteraceae bacterium]|nr:hypothetical protein [Paracoccaceae bacterium]
MGRESEAEARFRGASGRVLALLEPDEVILRRAIRARIPRATLAGWRAAGAELVLETPEGPLVLVLGEAEAAAWARALDRPAPRLADKLGIGPAAPAFVAGDAADPALAAALEGARAAAPEAAAAILAVIADAAGLAAALALAAAHPALPVWCVHPKGRVPVGEAAVRAAFRGMGWIDSKSCAVSARLSATRYRRRAG